MKLYKSSAAHNPISAPLDVEIYFRKSVARQHSISHILRRSNSAHLFLSKHRSMQNEKSTQSRRTDDIYNIAPSSQLANDDASKRPINCTYSDKGFAFTEESSQDVFLPRWKNI